MSQKQNEKVVCVCGGGGVWKKKIYIYYGKIK